MHQNDLNRAVAHSTGETVSCVRRLGFQPLTRMTDADEEALIPRRLDWDDPVEALPGSRELSRAAY